MRASPYSHNPAQLGHFAAEIQEWDEMIANMDPPGVTYTMPTIRAYSGGHSTYIHDPDGSLIERVLHPLGLKDSKDGKVDPNNLTWFGLPVDVLIQNGRGKLWGTAGRILGPIGTNGL